MQYLYRAGDDYVLMDMETFGQIGLGADACRRGR
jgi:translation elongation factor P/translation initiation factor 5A